MQVARPIPYVWFWWCVCWYGKHKLIWYISKHKHKDNLGTFGSVVERLEALRKRLNALRGFWERMGAFSKLGRLGRIIPYGMVCYVRK